MESLDYDQILTQIGEFGVWQKVSTLILWIPSTVCGIHAILFSFTGLQPSNGFRCRIPRCDGDNFKFNDFPSDIFPKDSEGSPDYCKFKEPVWNQSQQSCSHHSFTDNKIGHCGVNSEFVYNDFEFSETVVTQWNLVCDEQYKVALVMSAYMVGLMIGSFGCGWLSDKIGRKKTLFLCVLISSTSSLVGAFMPEYYSYTFTRLVCGIGAQGLFLASFGITMEIVGNKELIPCIPWVSYQTALGVLIQIPFALGECLLALVAMVTPTWQTLQWTVSAATFLQLLCWWLTPESPRWLIASNKHVEALALVNHAAKKNGKSLQIQEKKEEDIKDISDSKNETLGMKSLFSKELWLISTVLFFTWPIVTLGYYGITFGMANLSDDLFMNFIMSGLVEIPAYIVVILIMDIVGRKPLISGSLIFTGVSCITVGFLEEGVFKTVLAMVGKFFASSNFAIVYMYTAELYPTIIRSTGVGNCSLMARIGGAIPAPYIALYLPTVTSSSVPYLLMGGLAVLGGCLTLLLPETLGSSLPDTLEDVEKLKKNQKPFWKCVSPCGVRQ